MSTFSDRHQRCGARKPATGKVAWALRKVGNVLMVVGLLLMLVQCATVCVDFASL
ncbi:MAG: hypothetical protein OXS33_10240 [bacterium]|nr:hypothetical protein [bacterium]